MIALLLVVMVATVVQAQKKVSLFNGKNLDGWTIHGTEKWYVENGEMVCESGPDKQYGYLSTNSKYKNFELTLKFKQEANGNSGVFLRSSIEGVKVILLADDGEQEVSYDKVNKRDDLPKLIIPGYDRYTVERVINKKSHEEAMKKAFSSEAARKKWSEHFKRIYGK